MDCAGVAGSLVAYHLGVVSDEEADVVDEHLVACNACLKTYLALKRATNRAGLEEPRPEVKERLRLEVARAVAQPNKSERPRPRPLAVLGRRIPLYQGVALAAIAATITLAAPSVLRRATQTEATNTALVDTARSRAESLHIY